MDIRERLAQLEIPFNAGGIDPYGISREHLARVYGLLEPFYRSYFRVEVHGMAHVPSRGRAMIVGNHSGGYAIDAAMIMAACFFELAPPRLAQGMADKFLNRLPFLSTWSSRTGHFTGLPEHAARLLRDDRLLMVFPEGARGTAKLYRERYSLVRFGTGFVRLAAETGSPIIPVAVLGGGEAVPTVLRLRRLGQWIGTPYIPVTPYLLPLPLPVRIQIHFGEPIQVDATAAEAGAVERQVELVRDAIAGLIERARPGYRRR